MAVSMIKKTDITSAHRFFIRRAGGNVPVITDVVERGDGTVWIVSPLGGMGRSKLSFGDVVVALEIIEGVNVVKSERLV